MLLSAVSYIFGDNAGSRVTDTGETEPQTVAMTAPVRTEQPKKATVAMTSPVRTEVKSNFRNMRVSFVMPKKVNGKYAFSVMGKPTGHTHNNMYVVHRPKPVEFLTSINYPRHEAVMLQSVAARQGAR